MTYYPPITDDRVQLRPDAYLLTLLSPTPARLGLVLADMQRQWPAFSLEDLRRCQINLRRRLWNIAWQDGALTLPIEQVESLWRRYQAAEAKGMEVEV